MIVAPCSTANGRIVVSDPTGGLPCGLLNAIVCNSNGTSPLYNVHRLHQSAEQVGYFVMSLASSPSLPSAIFKGTALAASISAMMKVSTVSRPTINCLGDLNVD